MHQDRNKTTDSTLILWSQNRRRRPLSDQERLAQMWRARLLAGRSS